MRGHEQFDLLPCPLVRLDDTGVLLDANRAARELLGLGVAEESGERIDWDRLDWDSTAPDPAGPPRWRGGGPDAEARLVELGTPLEPDGWCLLRDRTDDARLLERVAAATRLSAVRPVVGGVVHALNNLLHLAMTLADVHGNGPDLESMALARRVTDMCRQSAAVLGAVRTLARTDALPWRPARMGELLDRSVALHLKVAEVAGVRVVRKEGSADRAVVTGPLPDVATVLSQVFLHAIHTSGSSDAIEVTAAKPEDGAPRAVIRFGLEGSTEIDAPLAALLAEPSRALGLHQAPGFGGDIELLGPSLLSVRLAGGDLVVPTEGGRRSFLFTMPMERVAP